MDDNSNLDNEGNGDSPRNDTPRNDSQRNDSLRSTPARSADEVLLNDLQNRANGASAKLRELLTGTIVVSVENLKKSYRIDWSQPQLKVEQLGAPANGDCTIMINEDNLLRVANGDLNPQIAMLSKKIRVEGKKDLAMYFFNLFAPKHF